MSELASRHQINLPEVQVHRTKHWIARIGISVLSAMAAAADFINLHPRSLGGHLFQDGVFLAIGAGFVAVEAALGRLFSRNTKKSKLESLLDGCIFAGKAKARPLRTYGVTQNWGFLTVDVEGVTFSPDRSEFIPVDRIAWNSVSRIDLEERFSSLRMTLMMTNGSSQEFDVVDIQRLLKALEPSHIGPGSSTQFARS